MPFPLGDDRPDARAGRGPAVAGAVLVAASVLRGAVAPAAEAMRPELWLTDWSLGWAATGFAAALLAAAAWLDLRPARRGAPALPALALAAAAILVGAALVARGPWTLLLARLASGGAAGVAVIAALHGARDRGGAALVAAAPAGILLATVAGGALARRGWRGALAAAALLALGAALLAYRRRARAPAAPGAPLLAPLAATGAGPALRALAADRSRLCAVAGAALWTLAASALLAWLPAFLERVRGVPRGAATLGVGAAAAVLAFAGTLAGRAATRALARRLPDAAAFAGAAGAAGAALAATGAIFAWRPALYLPALLATFLLAAAAAPGAWAAARDRVAEARDPALATLAAVIVLLADAVAPLAVGTIAHPLGLWKGLLLVPIAFAAAGLLLASAAALRARPVRAGAGDQSQARPSASA